MKAEDIKNAVKSGYANVALRNSPCCGAGSGCCGSPVSFQDASLKMGYSPGDLSIVPEDANLGLGCGNPVALASLVEGEIVLDLGSGAGFDCFIASSKVGEKGRVIGVDMTPEMVEKAWKNAQTGGFQNVEFRLGEIENIPVEEESADVVISNCVINLSPDKAQVFREAYRVLKPGGRLMVSDIVLLKELPDVIRSSMEAYVGCIAGAVMKEDYLAAIQEAGFHDIQVLGEEYFDLDPTTADPERVPIFSGAELPYQSAKNLEGAVASVKVLATKPD